MPPTQTTIEVEPKGLRVVRGAPVTIQAAAAGAIPTSLELLTWTGTNERGEPVNAEKTRHGKSRRRKIHHQHRALGKNLRYRVATGANLLRRHIIAEAVDPPEIANVQSLLYPPAYAGLASVASPEGNIEGLKGSSLRLDAVATKEVVKAEIVIDDGKKVPLKIDGSKLQANLVLFQSQTYRIVVEDVFGSKIRRSPTNCASSPMVSRPSIYCAHGRYGNQRR